MSAAGDKLDDGRVGEAGLHRWALPGLRLLGQLLEPNAHAREPAFPGPEHPVLLGHTLLSERCGSN